MDWGSLKSKLDKEVTQTWRATNNGKLVGSVDWRIWRGWRIIQVRLPKGLIWEQKLVIRACLGILEIMPSYWEWEDWARRSLCFRINWEETVNTGSHALPLERLTQLILMGPQQLLGIENHCSVMWPWREGQRIPPFEEKKRLRSDWVTVLTYMLWSQKWKC